VIPVNDTRLEDGFQAITSLSRAVAPNARMSDVGPFCWVLLRNMVPCDAMALFTVDPTRARVRVSYAAGVEAAALRAVRRPLSTGIAGWVALHRRPVLNAEPMFDLGCTGRALRSSALVPLVENGRLVAVLALYSQDLLAFTDEHLSLLELLGPRLALGLAGRSTVPAADALPVAARAVLRSRTRGARSGPAAMTASRPVGLALRQLPVANRLDN
jgi:GAF domain-containing protein